MKKLIFIISVLASLSAYADPVTVPNTFSAGTPAKASEVNANFTALANAVNALARQPVVRDAGGNTVGFLSSSNFSRTTQNGGIGSFGSSAVIITSVGDAFMVNILKNSFNNTGQTYLLFSSMDCSGDFKLFQEMNISNERLIPLAVYHSPNAYILTDEPNNFWSYSFKVIYGDNTTSECHKDSGQWQAYGINKIVDLSVFTPPFSVH